MKYQLKDKLITYLIVLTISLIITSIVTIISIAYLPIARYIIPSFIISLLIVIFIVRICPDYVVCLGLRRIGISSTLQSYLIQRFCHYNKFANSSNVKIIIVDSPTYLAWYLSTELKTYIFITSSVVMDFNEIDLDCVIAYLSNLHSTSYALRDSCILLLATITERAIITSLISASLVHLVRPCISDSLLDSQAIMNTKFAVGYRKMIEKLVKNRICDGNIPYSISMNAIANVKGTNVSLGKWFRIHQSLEKRLHSINQMNQSLS